MGGWKDGGESRVKDCLQQSKTKLKSFVEKFWAMALGPPADINYANLSTVAIFYIKRLTIILNFKFPMVKKFDQATFGWSAGMRLTKTVRP